LTRRLRAGAAGAAVLACLLTLAGCSAPPGTAVLLVPRGDPAFQRPGPPFAPYAIPTEEPSAADQGADPDQFAYLDAPGPDGDDSSPVYPQPPAVPDLQITWPVTLADGSTRSCVLEFSATGDPKVPTGDEAAATLRDLLVSTDWSTVLGPPTTLPPRAPGQAPLDGQAEAQIRSSELASRIVMSLADRALPEGFIVFGSNRCP
jgi:hypothetical protein